MSGASAQTAAAKATAAETEPLVAAFKHPTLAAALVAALASLTVVEKASTADAGSYSYDYADLAAITKATKKKLAEHGVTYRQNLHAHGTGLAVSTVLLHESGEEVVDGPLPFPFGRDAQATGSLITDHRRYALLASLGLATGDDDDGAKGIPQAPVVVWNDNMVKARLLELLKDKGKAREAWTLGHGDDLTEFSPEVADRLAAEWIANQPAEDPADPGTGSPEDAGEK